MNMSCYVMWDWGHPWSIQLPRSPKISHFRAKREGAFSPQISPISGVERTSPHRFQPPLLSISVQSSELLVVEMIQLRDTHKLKITHKSHEIVIHFVEEAPSGKNIDWILQPRHFPLRPPNPLCNKGASPAGVVWTQESFYLKDTKSDLWSIDIYSTISVSYDIYNKTWSDYYTCNIWISK